MSDEPIFLPIESGGSAHKWGLRLFGGVGFVDSGKLDAAMNAAKWASYYGEADHHTIAATYAVHVGGAHPFTHGNKAAATFLALTYLEMNGVTTGTPVDAGFFNVVSGIASGRSVSEVAEVLRKNFPSGAR
jgi:prophage maintenance system killer protein